MLVRFPHSLPPCFAGVTIDLFIVPCPHVLLQEDHSDSMQSTKDGMKEDISNTLGTEMFYPASLFME